MQQSSSGAYAPTKVNLLSLRERPATRVAESPSACTSLELLSAAIGGRKQFEIAEAILARYNGDLHRLFQATAADLESIPGIGAATAARLKALLLLAKRLPAGTARASIRSISDAKNLCAAMAALDHEEFRVIALDAKNQVVATVDLYKGTVNSISAIRPADVMRVAIQWNASSIVIAHNHPSGDPTPSAEDVACTRSLVKAGQMMDVELIDHIVVGHGTSASLKERGLIQ